jgi:hypothetical protein
MRMWVLRTVRYADVWMHAAETADVRSGSL